MRLTSLRRSIVTLELFWAASLLLATYVAGRASGGVVHSFALIDYAIGSFVCHQRPERSFHLWGAQLPVCARCAGVYAGAAVAAFLPAFPWRLHPARLVAAAATPAAVTLVYEWTTGVMPSNGIRAATGLAIGAAVMVILLDELRGD
jgi:uncharacterized membrane protein